MIERGGGGGGGLSHDHTCDHVIFFIASLDRIKMVSSAKPCSAGLVSALDECEVGTRGGGPCEVGTRGGGAL